MSVSLAHTIELAQTQPAAASDFEKFTKLNKINKLRDLLRSDRAANKHLFPGSNNYDLIDYFKNVCTAHDIKLNYVQYLLPDTAGYYGEIFLESFRLLCERNKKRKKCQYYAHKSALELLCSDAQLAVKVAPKQKRDANIRLDNDVSMDVTSDSHSFDSNLASSERPG